MNCEVENTPTVPRSSPRKNSMIKREIRVQQHVEPERPARERPSLTLRQQQHHQDQEFRPRS